MKTPKQDLVVEYVATHPGCPKIGPARAVAPNGSLKYGYRTVDRAIVAGRINAYRTAQGVYRLFVVS